jgi:hypothetical protein
MRQPSLCVQERRFRYDQGIKQNMRLKITTGIAALALGPRSPLIQPLRSRVRQGTKVPTDHSVAEDDLSIQPTLMRACKIIASHLLRETLKRSRMPSYRVLLPDLSSLQPQRASVAQAARSSSDLIPCSPNTTSISVVTPGISFNSSATPSLIRLASKLVQWRRGSRGVASVSSASDMLAVSFPM